VSGLRVAVERSWSEGPTATTRALALLTTPLSWLWWGATAIRNHRHDRRPARRLEGLRVVSVGNLAVGGTGKTPVSSWVVDRLLGQGARPAVVLSGYGEDEILLHRRWHPEVPVFADPRRASALARARDAGARVVVLDDGFQHRAVARELDLVLLAAEHRFPGHVMPRGPYREPASALRRADAVLITRRSADVDDARRVAAEVERIASGLVVGCLAISPDGWVDVHGRSASAPKAPLLAVCALARPKTFTNALRAAVEQGTDIRARGFPDHHDYSERDMSRLREDAASEGRTIVATEKDAVKMARLDTTPDTVRILRSRIEWDWGQSELEALVDHVTAGRDS